jgi:hypothetical protein
VRILIITLDFNPDAVHNEDVYALIKTQGVWWHYMKATWLVHTTRTAQQVAEALTPVMKEKGRMLIAELHRPYQGLLVPDAWKWINDRVN